MSGSFCPTLLEPKLSFIILCCSANFCYVKLWEIRRLFHTISSHSQSSLPLLAATSYTLQSRLKPSLAKLIANCSTRQQITPHSVTHVDSDKPYTFPVHKDRHISHIVLCTNLMPIHGYQTRKVMHSLQ